MSRSNSLSAEAFIERWSSSGAAETANFQSFAKELCQLIGVPEPDVTSSTDTHDNYVFEKRVPMDNGDGTTSVRQFGFISTNSIHQPFNRKVVQLQLSSRPVISLAFAIPDHPWIDASDGAAVRIAMTVVRGNRHPGNLVEVVREFDSGEDFVGIEFRRKEGIINANLTVGVDVSDTVELRANVGLARQGLIPLGNGFRLRPNELDRFGIKSANLPNVIRRYRIGADLVQREEEKYVIDLFGMSADDARQGYPKLFQHLLDTVKPERDHNKRKTRRENWWLFGENAATLRPVLNSICRYIATCRTAKHRIFTFLDSDILPDAKIVAIGLEDAFLLGVLSSRVHVVWAMEAGGWLGVGNDSNYNHADCFAKFPFPVPSENLKIKIRDLAEALDAHRKARQAENHDLTITQMYNVIDAIRNGRKLNDKENDIHKKGLISILLDIHRRLDAAVIESYGWPVDIEDSEILERLVALNKQRQVDEARGIIHWLRPDYQNPGGKIIAAQQMFDIGAKHVAASKITWPAALPDQIRMIQQTLSSAGQAVTVEQVAAKFKGARRKTVDQLLATLVSLGQARITEEGRYTTR